MGFPSHVWWNRRVRDEARKARHSLMASSDWDHPSVTQSGHLRPSFAVMPSFAFRRTDLVSFLSGTGGGTIKWRTSADCYMKWVHADIIWFVLIRAAVFAWNIYKYHQIDTCACICTMYVINHAAVNAFGMHKKLWVLHLRRWVGCYSTSSTVPYLKHPSYPVEFVCEVPAFVELLKSTGQATVGFS